MPGSPTRHGVAPFAGLRSLLRKPAIAHADQFRKNAVAVPRGINKSPIYIEQRIMERSAEAEEFDVHGLTRQAGVGGDKDGADLTGVDTLLQPLPSSARFGLRSGLPHSFSDNFDLGILPSVGPCDLDEARICCAPGILVAPPFAGLAAIHHGAPPQVLRRDQCLSFVCRFGIHFSSSFLLLIVSSRTAI